MGLSGMWRASSTPAGMPGPTGAQKSANTSIVGPPGKWRAASTSAFAPAGPVKALGSSMVDGLNMSNGFTIVPWVASPSVCLYLGTTRRARQLPRQSGGNDASEYVERHVQSLVAGAREGAAAR